MDKLKENAKSIVAFVAGILINAILALINGQSPWPTSLKEWGQYLGTALLAGASVWVAGNKLNENQIVKQAVKQGVTVVTDQALNAAVVATQNAVNEITQSLPKDVVGGVATHVSQRVSDVLKGVSSNFDLELKDVL